MTQTRIYLPLDTARMRELAETRSLARVPLGAFAVTGRIERSLPTGDEEEWEYAALCEAAEAATAGRGTARTKRVIAAADVDGDWVSEAASGGAALAAVTVSEPVQLRDIVSFHVDEAPGADGTEDLLWYDATELDEVIRLL